MRRRWDHEAPEGHQPCPRDNTSRYVYAQVSRWLRTDEPVHPETAMEIAAWWHGPARADTAITAFASHGAVMIHGIDGFDVGDGRGDDLTGHLDALAARRIARHPEEGRDYVAETTCLRALCAYVHEVEHHATRYRRNVWHGGYHRWSSTDKVDVDSCITCGAEGTLRPDSEDGDYGSYFGGDGQPILECTGRVDLVHGYERHCEADNGRPCEAARDDESGSCGHIDHTCNCNLCL